MKKLISIILLAFPVPFLFHFYEYTSHLAKKEATFLLPALLIFIAATGITSRNMKLPLFFGMNVVMVFISLTLGYFFIVDDGSWFIPFGRDFAIIFVAVLYVLGQLLIRGVSRLVFVTKENANA